MLMVKAGPGGRRADRRLAAAAWPRATSSSTAATPTTPTPSAARKYVEDKGPALHRHGRLRRRRGRAQGPQHDARRQRRRLAAGEADLPGDRRQGRPEERHSLLRMGRPARRRALREDGPQRHRIRRHAADLRSLLHDEGGARPHERRALRRLRRVESRRARQLPDRNHARHLQRQGRRDRQVSWST